MPDVVQSTSPIVTTSEVLDSDATKEASLSFIEQINKQKAQQGDRTTIVGQRRGPGRPKGSTNKPKGTEDGKDDKGQTDLAKELAALERKRNAKKQKVDDYTNKVINEFNDQIMLWLLGAGVPSAVLYQDGQAPVQIVNNKYTEVGNLLAIKPIQARAFSRLIVEAEYSERGIQVANAMAGSTVGLVITGLVAIAMGIQYGRQLTVAMAKIQPLIEAKRQADAYKAQQAQEGRPPQPQRTMHAVQGGLS